ncbi:homing endonuclease [Bacillus phage Moonbeam]|uniref:Uncharacterized protein n=1 Tax=Bacillus phage Moonbeam TaxID=1540091 RepID=A0A0A0RNK1_9CAUD|nr:homing endonuclease [Bacillus phage Moonbeam]AIW03592.1 hypothetical protein CPT_Moonbeam194 [Bacillus phage Moonbeam]
MKFESKKTVPLVDKIAIADERGYTLNETENFTVNSQVHLIENSTGFEYLVHWGNFTKGIKPSKTTLESKIKYAASRGYTLHRKDNFTTSSSVEVTNRLDGLEYRVQWDHFVKGASPAILTLEGKRQLARNRGYTLLEDTDFSNRSKVIIRCNESGVEYEANWGSFTNGNSPRHTTLNQKIKETAERGYKLLETDNFYTNSQARIKSLATGREYTVWYASFLHKGYQENNSKGESILYYFFLSNLASEYSFEYQYRVDYSESKKGFFDFCIKDKNGRTLAFVEYNGKQHYEPCFGQKAFELTLLSDKLKQEYAAVKKVPLIVIPYTYSTQKEIVDFASPILKEYLLTEYVEFTPKWSSLSSSTLEDKQRIAEEAGYTLHPDTMYNFVNKDRVTVINQQTGEEWEVQWGHFLKCVVPNKTNHKRVIKLSLEEKKQIASSIGYTLLEEEDFPVINKVRLMNANGEEITRGWRTIHKQYKKRKDRGDLSWR